MIARPWECYQGTRPKVRWAVKRRCSRAKPSGSSMRSTAWNKSSIGSAPSVMPNHSMPQDADSRKRARAASHDVDRTERSDSFLHGAANVAGLLGGHIAQEFQRVVEIVGLGPSNLGLGDAQAIE